MNEIDGIKLTTILDALKSGDDSAFTSIYNYFWEKLYIAAYARLKDVSRSEEVVQQVFLQLWRKRSCLEIHDLSAYLAAMTRYAVYQNIAAESKLKEREKQWCNTYLSSNIIESDIENKFLLKFIRELSNELPEKCRLVFVYNKLEDQSLKDVALKMNISQKTAEAHLTKALRFIRLKLSNIISLLAFISIYF